MVVADALAAKRAKSAPAAKTSTKPVAATAPSSDDETPTFAAILPSIDVYSSDSEGDAGISDHDMSGLFKSKHLIWHCQVHGLTTDFPVTTRTMIDNGAHVILMGARAHSPELVVARVCSRVLAIVRG